MILCCSLNLQLFMMQQQAVQLPISTVQWYEKIFEEWKEKKFRYIDNYRKSPNRREILNLARAKRSSSNECGEFYLRLQQLSVNNLEQQLNVIDKDKITNSSINLTSMIRSIFNYKVIFETVITSFFGFCIPFTFFLEVIKPESFTAIYTSSIIIMVIFTGLFLLHRFYFRQRTVDRRIASAFDTFEVPLNDQQEKLYQRILIATEKDFYHQLTKQMRGNKIPIIIKIVIDHFQENQLRNYLQVQININNPEFRPQYFVV